VSGGPRGTRHGTRANWPRARGARPLWRGVESGTWLTRCAWKTRHP
jgi:hypothetical protein